MRKIAIIAAALAFVFALAGCSQQAAPEAADSAGGQEQAQPTEASPAEGGSPEAAQQQTGAPTEALAPGTYTATFSTDSSMFHVNEANDGKGVLTVADDGTMTIHVSLASKKIEHLFPGLAADAKLEGAELLEPTIDTITYDDGYVEDVYGFDIPVPAIGEEFDVALVGTKGTWYDHKVSVSDPIPVTE